MNIIVFGGRGFLGSYVTCALKGHKVFTADTSTGGKMHRQVSIVNPDEVRQAVQGMDLIINLVGLSPLKQGPFREVHVLGVMNLLATKKPLIHISALGADSTSPIEYLQTKAQAEELIRTSGIQHAIIRPSVLFGESAELFKQLDRFPVFPMLPTKVQPVFAGDVATVIASLVKKPQGTHELAGVDVMTMYQFAKQYRTVLSIPFFLFKPFFWLACMLRIAKLSPNQYKSLFLDNTSVPYPEMVTRYADWLRKRKEKTITVR